MVVFVRFDVGWAYRNWRDKGVIVRECVGQVWGSGSRELGVSMGLGVCIAGDHPRHGAEYLAFYFWQHVYTVTSGSDPHGAHNADSDGRPITESD